MKRLLPHLPALILLLGALLRIGTIGSSAIWYDEANTLYRARVPLLQLYSDTQTIELSGDLLLDVLVRPLMGLSENVILLRLPALLAGLVSLWLVWKLMRWFGFTLPQQILTALFAAFLPGLLWLGTDARVYGLTACIFLAGLWFLLENRSLGLLACTGLLFYCHYTGAAFAAALILIGLLIRPGQGKRLMLVAGLTLLAWLPALWHLLTFARTQGAWISRLEMAWMLQSILQALWVNATFNGWFVLASLFGLFMLGVLFFTKSWRCRARIIPLLAWAVPLGGMMAASWVLGQNYVIYRTVQPVLYAMSLWLGWELGRWSLSRGVVLAAWAGLLACSLVLYRASDRGGRLDQAAAQIRAEWQPGDVLEYTTGTTMLPMRYYLPDLPSQYYPLLAESTYLWLPTDLLPPSPPPGPVLRRWVVLPESDELLTDAQIRALDDYIRREHIPLLSVRYMQAAKIDIYLVEE